MIRKDYALCVEAIEIALTSAQCELTNTQRARELLTRLQAHVEFMCSQCDGLGRNLKLNQPCTYCAGTGIEPTADPRLSFCAPEQIISPDDTEGVGVGFVTDDATVITGRELQENESAQD